MTGHAGPTRPGREAGHIVRLVRNRLGDAAVVDALPHADGDRLVVVSGQLVELITFLQRDPDTDLQLLVNIAALDRGPSSDARAPRYDVVYHLRSPRLGYRAFVTVRVPAHEPSVPSITGLFAAAEHMEREVHEMVGVYPEGHPKLRPLLLYAGFTGHPLRKDYQATLQQPLVAPLDGHHAPLVFGPPPGDAAGAQGALHAPHDEKGVQS